MSCLQQSLEPSILLILCISSKGASGPGVCFLCIASVTESQPCNFLRHRNNRFFLCASTSLSDAHCFLSMAWGIFFYHLQS